MNWRMGAYRISDSLLTIKSMNPGQASGVWPPMSRFFLHIPNSIGLAVDEEGQEFPDLATAEAEALNGIRSVLAEELRGGVLDLRGQVEISDQAGKLVRVVRFREAVELHSDEE